MAYRLGVDTGSAVNWLAGNAQGQEPVVGLPATVLHWTDREAGVVRYWDGYLLHVETTKYPNLYTYRRNRRGRWVQVVYNEATGRWRQEGGGCGLYLGEAEDYRDPSF
mgnify:CR=1 FL=1|jgi:hypothetical protein